MDKRIERQLRWVEEALGRLRIEVMSLAVLVERKIDVSAFMIPTISRLEGQLETVKDRLSWPKVVSKEEISVEDLSFEGTTVATEEKLAGLATTIPEGVERKGAQ